LQRFVLAKFESGKSWESCDLYRNLMSKIFAMAKRWGYFSGDNPSQGIELPEKKPVREKHALTPEQIPQLLSVLREPARTMVHLAILTGLRIGEILGLRWRDLDLVNGLITVEQACYRGLIGLPKTRGSRRTLPLPQELVGVLKAFYKRSAPQSPDQLVFRTRNSTPLGDTNLLHRHLKPAGQKIGAPWLSWHTFRRTHATLLPRVGASMKDVQMQLGHSKLSTTSIYVQPMPEYQRDAVERLAQLVTNGDEFGQKTAFPRMLTGRTQ
jgi:integrase